MSNKETVSKQEKESSLANHQQLEMIKKLYNFAEINKMLGNLKKDFYSLTTTEASKMIAARKKGGLKK